MFVTADHIAENMPFQIIDLENGHKRISDYIFYDPKIWEFRVIDTFEKDKEELEKQYSQDGWIRQPSSKYVDQMVFRRKADINLVDSRMQLKNEVKETVIFKRKRKRIRRFRKKRCEECRKILRETGKRPMRCTHESSFS